MVHEELVERLGVFWPAFSSIKDGQDIEILGSCISSTKNLNLIVEILLS